MKRTITILFLFISVFLYSSNLELLIIEQDTLILKTSLLPENTLNNSIKIILGETILWRLEKNNIYLNRQDSLIFAKWVNDSLSIEYGKSVPFPRMGEYESGYIDYFEFEIELVIENGEVMSLTKYQNIELRKSGFSIFNSNLMDTIVDVLNNSIQWDLMLFNNSESNNEWIEDIFVLKLYADGRTEIRIYDEDAIKNGDYSCGECKEVFVRQKEIDRVLSSLQFLRIKKYNKAIDSEIVFDIKYDLTSKRIINPYSE